MASGSWIVIVTIIIIFTLIALLRKRGGPAKYPEIVQALLYDIKFNQALAGIFMERSKPRHFENTNWQMNKNQIGFLSESLKVLLREIFALVEEYNKTIKAAKKEKSDSYKTLEMTHFKELLEKCRLELEGWLIEKTGYKELPPKYPSFWGTFFGER
jgi:hypothetical protein